MKNSQETKQWGDITDPFVKLSNAFIDERGYIQSLVEGGGVHSVQIISSKAKTTRANHWHQKDSQVKFK